MTQQYQAAEPDEPIKWSFEVPPINKRGKMQLLTIGGLSVTGHWQGHVGQYFVAWHKLVPYDQQQFDDAITNYRNSPHFKDDSRCH